MQEGTKRDIEQIQQLQAQINSMQQQLGWTQAQLARVIYCELHEDDDDEKRIKNFCAALKKQLLRDTTAVELLQRYVRIIGSHEDFRRASLVVPNPIRLGAVDISILRGVSEVARDLLKDEEFTAN